MSRPGQVRSMVCRLVLGAVLTACEPASATPLAIEGVCAEPHVATLYAGRTIDAGDVSVSNTATELIVGLDVGTSWTIDLVHLYAGTGPVPTNPGGNVALGRFPYGTDPNPPAAGVELRVPLSELGVTCGDTIVVAVHADLRGTDGRGEGAWAFGDPFTGRQWGWSFSYVICCAPEGCTLTQGYWKNHAEDWPLSTLTLGSHSYTQSDLLTILHTPPRGDASLILAHQLIAALLNVASGASASGAVQDALADAHAWLIENHGSDGRLPHGVSPSTSAGQAAVAIADALVAYNEGRAGTPHCE